MAIIKHISIKNSPLALLKYITGAKKDTEVRLVTGLNCSVEPTSANEEMSFCYKTFSGDGFSKKASGGGKQKIKMHHYIQSFKKGEITPEKAHEIALKWAGKVFGNDRQILIATHEDTGHIHTHFAVNAYDFKGRHWIDNKETLQRCRDISDEIVKSYGLRVIEKSKSRKNRTYTEWLERQSGTSWKQQLCNDIDNFILLDNVKNVDNLVEELRKNGYLVKQGKYISVRPERLTKSKFVRTLRLGDGYGIEELQYRIENKNREMPLSAVIKYMGIQREYALCLRQLQISVYRKNEKPRTDPYAELRKNAELLCYLCDNNIHSKEDFENHVNAVAENSDKIINSYNSLEQKIKDYEFLTERGERYFELLQIKFPIVKEREEIGEIRNIAKKYSFSEVSDIQKFAAELEQLRTELSEMRDEYDKAKADKKAAGDNYKTLLRQLDSEYNRFKTAAQRELAEYEKNLPKPKKSFIDEVQKMSKWSDNVQAKTAEIKWREMEQEQRKQARKNQEYYR